jgi:superfamily II DNA or RNA helicase
MQCIPFPVSPIVCPIRPAWRISTIAKQGLDCPRLDTLILALPCKNVTQAVGRIMRRDPDHGARIYDIYDMTPVCRLGQRKRSEYYREQLKWKVESFQASVREESKMNV